MIYAYFMYFNMNTGTMQQLFKYHAYMPWDEINGIYGIMHLVCIYNYIMYIICIIFFIKLTIRIQRAKCSSYIQKYANFIGKNTIDD